MKLKNTKIIDNFYENWINKNIEELKSIYHQDCIFNDPAFVNLNYEKTIKMWSMLFGRNNKKKIIGEYNILSENDDIVKTKLTIKYNFGKKHNLVINEIYTTFKIKDGKIINHEDVFDFKKWCNQAFDIKKDKPSIYYTIIQKLTRIKMKKAIKK